MDCCSDGRGEDLAMVESYLAMTLSAPAKFQEFQMSIHHFCCQDKVSAIYTINEDSQVAKKLVEE